MTHVAGEQYVILAQSTNAGNGMPAIGTRREIVTELSPFNTAPERPEGDALYGPGFIIELPPNDPVTQMLLTIVEEEIAWQVIMRLAKHFKWKLLDMASGRELVPS